MSAEYTKLYQDVLQVHQSYELLIEGAHEEAMAKPGMILHGKVLGMLSVLVALEDVLGVDCIGKPVDRSYRDALKSSEG